MAYTRYTDPAVPATIRVYTFDPASQQTRQLSDQPRSEVLFVKDGWVWYHEEVVCDPSQPSCGPWGTAPSGKDFAMDLSTGVETTIVFASGESPAALESGWASNYGGGPPDYWPNS